jgi:hypothetical protein
VAFASIGLVLHRIRRMRPTAAAVIWLALLSTTASAQVTFDPPQRRPVLSRRPVATDYRNHATIFAGLTGTPSVLPIVGGAWGGGTPDFGFELELSHTRLGRKAGASWGTFLASMFVRVPVESDVVEYYGIGGLGLYGETHGDGRGAGGLTRHFGFGAKYRLTGPVRARIEYRLFLLETTPDSHPSVPANHRLTAGVCIGC